MGVGNHLEQSRTLADVFPQHGSQAPSPKPPGTRALPVLCWPSSGEGTGKVAVVIEPVWLSDAAGSTPSTVSNLKDGHVIMVYVSWPEGV